MRTPRRAADVRPALELPNVEAVIAALEELATEARRRRLTEVFGSRLDSVTVVMDAPHDPHNGAAVLRSCDAFGVCRVHVVERYHRFSASGAVAKGTEKWVQVVTHPTTDSAVTMLRSAGHLLVGTHPAGEMKPEELADIPRLALVMGNEHDGICDELEAACDSHVRVPMRGFVESLNVSVTAAILLSHATRGRPGDLDELELRRWYARALLHTVPRALDILAARGVAVGPPHIDAGLPRRR